jgi:hypothetical protein
VAGPTIPSTVNPAPLLELLDRRLQLRSEGAIDGEPEIGRSPQRTLQSLHRIAGGA